MVLSSSTSEMPPTPQPAREFPDTSKKTPNHFFPMTVLGAVMIFVLVVFVGMGAFHVIRPKTRETIPERSPQTISEPSMPPDVLKLVEKARRQGNVGVIVKLRIPIEFQPENKLSPEAAQVQRMAISQVRHELLSNLSTYNATILSASDEWDIPSVALSVDADALLYLIQSPQVTSIIEDTLMQLHYKPQTSNLSSNYSYLST